MADTSDESKQAEQAGRDLAASAADVIAKQAEGEAGRAVAAAQKQIEEEAARQVAAAQEELTRQANAAAKQAEDALRSSKAGKAVSEKVAAAEKKLAAAADKYGKHLDTALAVGEKLRAAYSANARHIEAYACMVLLLFGASFVTTVRTYEVMLRLGFLTVFGSLFAEAHQALQEVSGASGLDKFRALYRRLTPLGGRVAQTIFVAFACVRACVRARVCACVRACVWACG
jgi:hypothetical protein